MGCLFPKRQGSRQIWIDVHGNMYAVDNYLSWKTRPELTRFCVLKLLTLLSLFSLITMAASCVYKYLFAYLSASFKSKLTIISQSSVLADTEFLLGNWTKIAIIIFFFKSKMQIVSSYRCLRKCLADSQNKYLRSQHALGTLKKFYFFLSIFCLISLLFFPNLGLSFKVSFPPTGLEEYG